MIYIRFFQNIELGSYKKIWLTWFIIIEIGIKNKQLERAGMKIKITPPLDTNSPLYAYIIYSYRRRVVSTICICLQFLMSDACWTRPILFSPLCQLVKPFLVIPIWKVLSFKTEVAHPRKELDILFIQH